jgi:multisubunit Na+/H+ antiporter MnhC subunit
MTVIAIELAIIAIMLVLIHKQQGNNNRREKLIKKHGVQWEQTDEYRSN